MLSFSICFHKAITAFTPLLLDKSVTWINLWMLQNLSHNSLADLRGGARDARPPPPGPNSFNFMQFLGKNGQIIASFRVGAPSSGKSWIRHCNSWHNVMADLGLHRPKFLSTSSIFFFTLSFYKIICWALLPPQPPKLPPSEGPRRILDSHLQFLITKMLRLIQNKKT